MILISGGLHCGYHILTMDPDSYRGKKPYHPLDRRYNFSFVGKHVHKRDKTADCMGALAVTSLVLCIILDPRRVKLGWIYVDRWGTDGNRARFFFNGHTFQTLFEAGCGF